MAKRLTDYLKAIGLEIHNRVYTDNEGNFRPITNDEQLAREVWKRALGYEENITNENGEVSHRIHAPDPKAQQFIFERREGKFVTPQDDRSLSLLEKISDLARQRINDTAKQSLNDRNDTPTKS